MIIAKRVNWIFDTLVAANQICTHRKLGRSIVRFWSPLHATKSSRPLSNRRKHTSLKNVSKNKKYKENFIFLARPANYLRHRHQHCCFRASAHFSSFFGQRVEKFIFVFRCGWCLITSSHHQFMMNGLRVSFSHRQNSQKLFWKLRKTDWLGNSQSFFFRVFRWCFCSFSCQKNNVAIIFDLNVKRKFQLLLYEAAAASRRRGTLRAFYFFYYSASSDSNKAAAIYMTHRLVHGARVRARWNAE